MIHERARLSMLTSPDHQSEGMTFNDLKQLCSLTDGNLSRHLSVLEKAKMVEIVKGHDRNRPQTICRITPSGASAISNIFPRWSRWFAMRQRKQRMNPRRSLVRGLTPSRA